MRYSKLFNIVSRNSRNIDQLYNCTKLNNNKQVSGHVTMIISFSTELPLECQNLPVCWKSHLYEFFFRCTNFAYIKEIYVPVHDSRTRFAIASASAAVARCINTTEYNNNVSMTGRSCTNVGRVVYFGWVEYAKCLTNTVLLAKWANLEQENFKRIERISYWKWWNK